MDKTRLDNYTARNFLEQAAAGTGKQLIISNRQTRKVGVADPTIVDSFELEFSSKWEGYTLKLSTAFGEVVAYLFSGRPWTDEPCFISSQVNRPFHKYILTIWETWGEEPDPDDEEGICPTCGAWPEEPEPDCLDINGCWLARVKTWSHAVKPGGIIFPESAVQTIKGRLGWFWKTEAFRAQFGGTATHYDMDHWQYWITNLHEAETMNEVLDVMEAYLVTVRGDSRNALYLLAEALTDVG